jgi:uncharacterized membrane protein YfcA
MDWQIIILVLVAFGASLLTFFSGFGLGTLLTPVFLLFFPLPLAIALTAVVHLLNNVLKFFLVGKSVNLSAFLRFGIPSILGVIPGVFFLGQLDSLTPFYSYSIGSRTLHLEWINMCIGVLMILFAGFEIKKASGPKPSNMKLTLGGLASGFFGGISGHQGALRTAFLIRMGLSKESFIATGIAIALAVDLMRIPLYYNTWNKHLEIESMNTLFIALGAAFAGAVLGKQWLHKTTLRAVQKFVGIALVIFGVLLISGVIG